MAGTTGMQRSSEGVLACANCGICETVSRFLWSTSAPAIVCSACFGLMFFVDTFGWMFGRVRLTSGQGRCLKPSSPDCHFLSLWRYGHQTPFFRIPALSRNAPWKPAMGPRGKAASSTQAETLATGVPGTSSRPIFTSPGFPEVCTYNHRPSDADIVIAALGKAEFMTGDWIKPGAAVIDVGINAVDDPTSKKGYKLNTYGAWAKRMPTDVSVARFVTRQMEVPQSKEPLTM
eukprot:1156072-Pelagomonas_calceolata.AAC.4